MKKVIVVILSLAFQAVVIAAEPKTVSFTFEDNQDPVPYDLQDVEKIMKTSKTIQSMMGDTAGDTSPIPLSISKKSFDTLVELSQKTDSNFREHVQEIFLANSSKPSLLEQTSNQFADLAALFDAADYLDFNSDYPLSESIYRLMKEVLFQPPKFSEKFFFSTTEMYSLLSNEGLFNRLSGIKNKFFAYHFISRLLSVCDRNLWDFLLLKTEIPYEIMSFGGDFRSAISYDDKGELLDVTFEGGQIQVINLYTGKQKYELPSGLNPEDRITRAYLLKQATLLALVVKSQHNPYSSTIILYDLEQRTRLHSFPVSDSQITNICLMNNGQTLAAFSNLTKKTHYITFNQNDYKIRTEISEDKFEFGDTQGRHTISSFGHFVAEGGLSYSKNNPISRDSFDPIVTRICLNKDQITDLVAYDSEKDLIAGSRKGKYLYLISPEKLLIIQTRISIPYLTHLVLNSEGTKLAGVIGARRTIIEWDISGLGDKMNPQNNPSLMPHQMLLMIIAHYLYKHATKRTDPHLRINLYKYPHLKKIYDTLPKRLQEQTVAWFDWSDASTSHESSPLQLEEQEHGFKAVPVHTHADEDESSKNVGWMSWFKRFFKKK